MDEGEPDARPAPDGVDARPPRLRERKQRETRTRIADIGLRMFDERGYDQTTLEAVAQAAGVSPRTLYHYFKTKYDILRFWHDDGFEAAIGPAIRKQDASVGPFGVAREALLALVPLYETERLGIADRVWNSTDNLIAFKQLIYAHIEDRIFAALADRWPQRGIAGSLRAAAMMATGALRLAQALGRIDGEESSLTSRLAGVFGDLERLDPAGFPPAKRLTN